MYFQGSLFGTLEPEYDATFAEAVLAPLNRTGDAEGCRFEDGRVRVPAGFVDAYRAYVDQGWPRPGVAGGL